MSTRFKHSQFAIPVLFLAICYFPLFLHLGHLSLALYDESRLAVNAIEMLENGDFMVTHFAGKPDLWNTKPPLMVWIQVGFMSILGSNELALRLPSALAGFLTLLALWFFCRKELQKPWLGYLVVGVLVTTQGYIKDHVTRSADYDALLTLWLTLSVLFFFTYLNRQEEKYLYLTAGATALAVLTKSVAGMMFLPGMAIYWIIFLFWSYRKKIAGTPGKVSLRAVILSIGLFTGIVGSWYFFREIAGPGYLNAVWENEWAGRYLNALEKHSQPFSYYFHRILHFDFVPWVYFLPLGIFAGIKGGARLRWFSLLSLSVSIPFLLVLSFSETKLHWYIAPAFPLLAMLVGMGLDWIFRECFPTEGDTWQGVPKQAVLKICLVIALFGFPYKEIIENVYHPKPYYPCLEYGSFLRALPGYDTLDIVSSGYNAPARFYAKSRRRIGKSTKVVHPQTLRSGQKVIVCKKAHWKIIRKNYTYDTLAKSGKCCVLIQIR